MRRHPNGQFTSDPGGLLLERQRRLQYERQYRYPDAERQGSSLGKVLKWGVRLGAAAAGLPLLF